MILRFYSITQILNNTHLGPAWYAARRCAEAGGVLPITHSLEMAKALSDTLDNGATAQYIGLQVIEDRLQPVPKPFHTVWSDGRYLSI